MKYEDFLKTMDYCPFCKLSKDEIIRQNDFAVVILAKAPYKKDHLLIVPKRHVSKIANLKKKEKEKIFDLVFWAENKIRKFHDSLSILYREGDMKKVGKSVEHMHIHIIPDEMVGAIDKDVCDRDIYSDKKYLKLSSEIKTRFRGVGKI